MGHPILITGDFISKAMNECRLDGNEQQVHTFKGGIRILACSIDNKANSEDLEWLVINQI